MAGFLQSSPQFKHGVSSGLQLGKFPKETQFPNVYNVLNIVTN